MNCPPFTDQETETLGVKQLAQGHPLENGAWDSTPGI